MNVVICQFFGFAPPHLAAEMEIAEGHSRAGDEVTILGCVGDLLSCDDNMDHDWALCRRCIHLRDDGVGQLNTKNVRHEPIPRLNPEEKGKVFSLPYVFSDAATLSLFKVEGFELGEAILASIVSRYRNPEVDVVFDQNLVRRQLMSAYAVYLSMCRFLATRKTDRVYIFNGRYACMRAVFRACEKSGVACYVHDRGHDLKHYFLRANRLLHEIEPTMDEIREAWEAAAADVREQKGAEFFELRASGTMKNWYSFTGDQQQGLLPAGWKKDRHNVVAFISSEDEFVFTGKEWKNPAYPSQVAAMQQIITSLEASGNPRGVHVTVRMHPNLKGVLNASTRAMASLSSPHITVVRPEDPISSYALLHAADSVLAFGSTVGIEAVYWGRPSILCGASFYRDLGGCYLARTHNEVMVLIQRKLEPHDRLPALKYGYYLNTCGIPYATYVPSGVFEGSFRGHELVIKNKPRWCFRLAETAPILRHFINRLWLLRAKCRVTGKVRWGPERVAHAG